VGAAVAPSVADLLGIHSVATRPLTAVVVLLICGSFGSSLGYWLGEPVRARILMATRRGELDNVAGALFSIIAAANLWGQQE